MSVKKLIWLTGFCVLLAGCSSGGYYGDTQGAQANPTRLGVRYLLGRGVAQNDEKAFYYFNQAARDDDPFAQNEVAYMYAAGKGTSRDYAKAVSWYQKAADHGLASAQYNLGLMMIRGLGTPPNKALGLQWIKKSAAHGFEPAEQALAQYR